MGTVPVRNISDTFAYELSPNKNFAGKARQWLAATGSGGGAYGYWFFGKPYPLGATIQSAILHFYNDGLWSGSVTASVERLAAKPRINELTWNNKPAVAGTAYTQNKSGAVDGTEWAIDITPIIQFVSSGGAWYGIRLSVTGTTLKKIHSADSDNTDRRPWIEIIWSDKPEKPEDLNPRNNNSVSIAKPTLTMDYVDLSGDVQLDAVQVQIDAANDFTTGIDFDSGWVSTEVPQLDLNTTAYAGLANGSSTWWRCRTRDGAGLESDWSDSVQFKRTDKGVLTLTNPAVSPNNFFSESTPPIAWTFTGQTQDAYQVILTKLNESGTVIWDSGKLSGAATSITVPEGKIKNTLDSLVVTLRVWDNVTRQKEGGNTIYSEVVRETVYDATSATAVVTSLAAAQDGTFPWVILTFNRSTMPDFFEVSVDDVWVEQDYPAADAFVSGTSYSIKVKRVPARVTTTFKVYAKVNGINSNPVSVTFKTQPLGTWLSRPDGSDPIVIVKSGDAPMPAVDATVGTLQEVHQPIGGGDPILVTQYLRGFEGHVDGVLSDGIATGLTAKEMRNRFKKFKREVGRKYLLFMVDETIEVVIYNLSYRPRAKSGGVILYDISFDFFEVGN